MAKLTAGARRALPKSDFAIPGRFPMPDKSHARAALRDIPLANGLSPGQKATIKTKAKDMLGHANVFNPGSNHIEAAGPKGAKPGAALATHNTEKAKLFGRMGGY